MLDRVLEDVTATPSEASWPQGSLRRMVVTDTHDTDCGLETPILEAGVKTGPKLATTAVMEVAPVMGKFVAVTLQRDLVA